MGRETLITMGALTLAAAVGGGSVWLARNLYEQPEKRQQGTFPMLSQDCSANPRTITSNLNLKPNQSTSKYGLTIVNLDNKMLRIENASQIPVTIYHASVVKWAGGNSLSLDKIASLHHEPEGQNTPRVNIKFTKGDAEGYAKIKITRTCGNISTSGNRDK